MNVKIIQTKIVGLFICLTFLGSIRIANAATFFVSPNGNNSNNGSLTNPWQTLNYAFGRLQAGDTLFLRAGTFFERGIRVTVAGTATAPILIKAYPGEKPVVDGKITTPLSWELVDPLTQLYRSTTTVPYPTVYGHLGEVDLNYQFVSYGRPGPITTREMCYVDTGDYYVGPGVHRGSDGRVLIRLSPSDAQIKDGTIHPTTTDPNRVNFSLFPKDTMFEVYGSAAFIWISGLTIQNGYTIFNFNSGAHDILLSGNILRNLGQYPILMRDLTMRLGFIGNLLNGGVPPWISWSDVKMPSPGRPAHSFQNAAFETQGRTREITIKGNWISHFFDGMDVHGTPSEITIADNLFDTMRDDAIELGTGGEEIEVSGNWILGAFSGVSWTGGGAPSTPGTKYVHHNVIDTSKHRRVGHCDPQGKLPLKFHGPRGDDFGTGKAFNTHGLNSGNGPDPWKIYHNTIFVSKDMDNGGVGHCNPVPAWDPRTPNEVYNNIFVQRWDDYIARGCNVSSGAEINDGNLYWRTVPNPRQPLFLEFSSGSNRQNFTTLDAFRASSFFGTSRSYYAPGWEASGVEADPRLNQLFQPDPRGPAASGAIDLSAKPWPGAQRVPYRGALPPSP